VSAYVSGRLPVAWLTCLDRRDHAVEGGVQPGGVYEAACGVQVLPEASQEPPFPKCVTCLRFTVAWQHERSVEQRLGHRTKHARPGWFRRVLCWRGAR
jgi:hypothetical protein